MKKITLAFILGFIVAPATVVAINTAWDGATDGSSLQPFPFWNSADIKGDHFTATSTTATSTFPIASSTTFCLGSDCRSLWPSGGGGGSTLHVDGIGFVYPQDGDYHSAPKYVATSTSDASTFAGGIVSTASSTFTSTLHADGEIHFQDLFNLDAQLKSGINRLILKSDAGNSDAELFLAPTGSNVGSAATFSDSPNQNNFGGLRIGTDGTTNFIRSTSSGSGTTLPLEIQTNGNVTMSLDTDGSIDFDQLTTDGLLQVTGGNGSLSASTSISSAFIDSDIARDSELHDAVTLSGTPNYITLSGQDIVRGNINLASHVTGLLPYANFVSGSALSVTGRSANSSGLQASIAAGTDHQVLRRSGTTLGFGAVNLAQSAAVTGTLPVTRGGTGITSLGTGMSTWWGTPTSANLRAALTDETGTGVAVFGTSPTITTPSIATNFTFDSVTVTGLTGIDTSIVTGTAGTSGNCVEWDANGDIVDAGAACGTGGGGGGTLSTTTEKILAGAAGTVSYVTDEFMLGGSSSTTAEFLFDYASSTMEIRGTGTTTRFSTGGEDAVRDCAGEQNSDDGWECKTGLEWDLGTATAKLLGIGTTPVTAAENAWNWTWSGVHNFTSATVNFGAGAIDAITEIAAGLKTGADTTLVTGTAGTDQNLIEWDANGDAIDSGLATADVVTGASTDTFTNKTFDANGTGNSISNIDLTADVINTLPVGNGGTGITSLGTGVATWWGTPSSANFLSALTDTLDLGGETSFEIPNGTNNTVNADGQIAHDTTDDQLIIGADAKVIRTEEKIFSFTLASTSQEFVSGGELPVPLEKDGYTVTNIKCYVQGGTSVQMTLTDNTNAMDTLTCGTTATTDDGTIANATVTADELMYVDVGTISGTPDYVTFSVFGTWTRE